MRRVARARDAVVRAALAVAADWQMLRTRRWYRGTYLPVAGGNMRRLLSAANDHSEAVARLLRAEAAAKRKGRRRRRKGTKT